MKVLLTGANGYIGMRLLPYLIEEGHEVICCVRDKSRLELKKGMEEHISFYEVDFFKEDDFSDAPKDFDVAFFLIHAMSSKGDFETLEQKIAKNFVKFLDQTTCKQLIYLTGIVNEEELSKHLRSRLKTEEILREAKAKHTVLRAGIIVGSGSASFEIIRDLVEKLPVMIAPKWLKTRCQPIAIRNVIQYLKEVVGNKKCYDQIFDIGGPDILTYKEMLEQFANVRGFTRRIIPVPVMTPRLSSYWLYFVTSTSYQLAVNLVDSMKVDVVVQNEGIHDIIPIKLIKYKEAVRLAFNKIEQNVVVSSWKDALSSSARLKKLNQFVEVPRNGVFTDKKKKKITGNLEQVKENFFSIGGERGWYYGGFLWKIRGYLDKMVGGVGLRRGRTHESHLNAGDALDFWRVLVADKEDGRLLLYAEMKLPGEAWLEWSVEFEDGEPYLHQVATFRPNGVLGRLYWYSVLPFHYFIFEGMISEIEKYSPRLEGA